MVTETSLSLSQHIVRVGLFLFAAIAVFGGMLQMVLGQPDTSPRLDNVHRFMAGIYLGTGLICLWAGLTVRVQGLLVYLLALGVLIAGVGSSSRSARSACPSRRPSGSPISSPSWCCRG